MPELIFKILSSFYKLDATLNRSAVPDHISKRT